MRIEHPQPQHIPGLKRLWQQAFGDEAFLVDSFFRSAFSPERCLCVLCGDEPAACAYWLDGTLEGQKIAYVYAVATDSAYRGQGLCHRLMAQLHTLLKARGYASAILKPGSGSLFSLYAGMGYRSCCSVTEFTCTGAGIPAELRLVSTAEYARLHPKLLPPGSVVQGPEALDYLESYCRVYAGEDLLLCGWVDGNTLLVQEYLGDPAAAPAVTAALGADEGRFRICGSGTEHAKYLPLAAGCPVPRYLGLPLD